MNNLKFERKKKLIYLHFGLKFLFFILIVISSKRTAFNVYFEALQTIYELQNKVKI
jgi:hypothetical protein